MKEFYSETRVKAGSLIEIEEEKGIKYKVITCLNLSFFGRKGYMLNLVRV